MLGSMFYLYQIPQAFKPFIKAYYWFFLLLRDYIKQPKMIKKKIICLFYGPTFFALCIL